VGVCKNGFCIMWVCVRMGFCNMWVVVFVAFVLSGCVYVWFL